MSVHAVTRATPASVNVAYDAEQSYLYVAIDHRAGDPSPERPLRSWTPFGATFDYDADGRVRGIELMLPHLESHLGTVAPETAKPLYVDLVLDDEYATTSEEITYDPTSKVLQIQLDRSSPDVDDVYAVSDQLSVALRDGRLQTLWLKGVDLKV